ncbi:2878_t:CDS:2, partial [Cetraspora pellucida]
MGLKSGSSQKNYSTKFQKKHNRFKCPYFGCAKYERESKIEQKIDDTTFKKVFCNQLDDIINDLTKYYHLAEQRSLIDGEELTRLKCKLATNKDKIASLVNQNRELHKKYSELQEKHTTLQQEYQTLIENNNDYFIKRCELLKKEKDSLVKRNLELFEKIDNLKEMNKEIERLRPCSNFTWFYYNTLLKILHKYSMKHEE